MDPSVRPGAYFKFDMQITGLSGDLAIELRRHMRRARLMVARRIRDRFVEDVMWEVGR